MENASKALIIAGAILLSILIIGLGMLIFNQARDAISNTGMDAQKANAYNSEFLAYEGEHVTGSQVRSLIDIVKAHNIQNQDDETLQITLKNITKGAKDDGAKSVSGADIASFNDFKKNIKQGEGYKVQATDYDANTGFITEITISDPTGGSGGSGT